MILERSARDGQTGARVIAVLVLDRIANFDDFDPLRSEPDVDLRFVRSGDAIPRDAALVIIPGSKSTIGDLQKLRENGWERDLRAHVARGGHVLGICGGYQMLGRSVTDPQGLEGNIRAIDGLGLLDVVTEMAPEKVVRNRQAVSALYGTPLYGYEIHLGVTSGPDIARPFCDIDGRPDGAVSDNGRIMGTYLHGLFSSDGFRARFLAELGLSGGGSSYRESVERALDDIALKLESCGLGQVLKRAR